MQSTNRTNRMRGRSRAIPIYAAAIASAALKAYGQTSGTWIPTSTPSVDWYTPSQWIGSVPDNGGVATFGQNTGSSSSPTINENINLSQMAITSSSAYSFTGSGSITFPATGGTLNINAVPGVTNSFDTVGVPLAGGPLTVTGTGTVYLTKTNTFEGGVNISGGTLVAASDAALGATDLATDGVTLNSGTLQSPSTFTSSRPITVNGTSTLQFASTGTLNGVVSGSGTLIKGPASGGGLVFTNANNTFSGTIDENYDAAGVSSAGLYLSGNGALPDVSAIYTNSYLRIDNTSTVSNPNRLAATTALYMGGGLLRLSTASNAMFEEQAGTLQLTDGVSFISIQNTASGGQAVGLALGGALTRTNRAALYIRGNNLSDATPNASQVIASVVTPVAPVGLTGGGVAGTPNASIIPWITADVSASASTSLTTAQLVTWNASNGALRPLNSSEYAGSFGTATNNVQLTTSSVSVAVPAGGATCNSLTVTSNTTTGVTVTGSDPITVTSGAVVSNTAVSGYTGNTISAPIVFPTGVEGVLQCGTSLTTTAPISGTNGVTQNGLDGWTITGNGNNSSYSGQTTILGTVTLGGNLPLNQNSALGNSGTPIVMEGGDYITSALVFTTSSIVDRGFSIISNEGGLGSATLSNTNGTNQVTFNGAISMNVNNVIFSFGLPTFTPGAPAANATFNGVVSGFATVNDSTLNNPPFLQVSSEIFNGANTFTGGILLRNGWAYAGTNTAFGTGTVTTEPANPYVGTGGLHDLLPTIGATAGLSGTDTSRTLANNIAINGYGLNLNNAIPLTLTGSVRLSTSTEGAGVPTILIDFGAPTTLAGSISDGTANLGLEVAGTITLSGSNTFTGGVTLASAGTNISPDRTATTAGYVTFASPGALPAYSQLTVNAGATAVAANHGSGTYNTLLASSVSLDPAGLIDLTNNAMVIRSGSSIGSVTSQVAQGFGGGTWQGSAGITSSAAASNTTHLTALGVIVNDNGSGSPLYGSGGTIASTFGGTSTTVDGDILVKYTYYGDTNLDGKVDGTDYGRIDAAYLSQSSANPLTGWFNGDFNYDGVINGSDYTLIDNAFNSQGARLAASIASPDAVATAQIAGTAGSSAVPEPTAVAVIGLGALGLLGRRRRHA